MNSNGSECEQELRRKIDFVVQTDRAVFIVEVDEYSHDNNARVGLSETAFDKCKQQYIPV